MVNKAALVEQMGHVHPDASTGGDFYQGLITKHPDVRTYFKATDVEPSQVKANAKFQKLGVEFIKFTQGLVDHCDNDAEFKSRVAKLAVDHKNNKHIPFDLFPAVIAVWIDFVKAKAGGMNADQKKAWDDMYANFLKIAKENY